ncbi:unnamed protein product, partial [Brassica oleracea var. botrytis]
MKHCKVTIELPSFLGLGESKAPILLTAHSNLQSSVLIILVRRGPHENALLLLQILSFHLQPSFLSSNLRLQSIIKSEPPTLSFPGGFSFSDFALSLLDVALHLPLLHDPILYIGVESLLELLHKLIHH